MNLWKVEVKAYWKKDKWNISFKQIEHEILLYTSVSESGRNHPQGGDFDGQRAKKQRGDRGAKKHKGGESA